jgi:glycosyltransferase involved in cell wall biosynthesis
VVPHGLWRVDAKDRLEDEPKGRLLCFGTLRRNKGLDVAVDALRFLPDATLTLAGPPEDKACAAALAAQIAQSPDRARIHTRFEFIPAGEVSALFDAADLVLLPYRDFAAQSGVLHLALAHGVPVVVSDVGGMGELVREHAVGRVASSPGAEALAHQVREALWPQRHLALRRNVAAAQEAMSWERAAQRLAALYRRTLSLPEVALEAEAVPAQERV